MWCNVMTIKDKIMIYIYHKLNDLESEKNEINRSLRFQPMDSLDMYELMRSEIRISAWNEFVNDIYKIIINCK